jgi:hypothetical protein
LKMHTSLSSAKSMDIVSFIFVCPGVPSKLSIHVK